MYWENRGNPGNSQMNVFMRSSPFQKYIVFHSYYRDIHLAVVKITPIFPKFPSTLVPFSLILNHMSTGKMHVSNECQRVLKCILTRRVHCIAGGRANAPAFSLFICLRGNVARISEKVNWIKKLLICFSVVVTWNAMRIIVFASNHLLHHHHLQVNKCVEKRNLTKTSHHWGSCP